MTEKHTGLKEKAKIMIEDVEVYALCGCLNVVLIPPCGLVQIQVINGNVASISSVSTLRRLEAQS